jgi:acetyl-CoA carboxylase biotin carboxylase subunit
MVFAEHMFKKILIANRGEIALRIIRACRELGILTVAIHSEADEDSLHVRFADEAVCVGASPPSESYLNIPRILSTAQVTNVDAIHPGYGFLAENADFAEICESCGIVFIGPTPETISKMGDKAYARSAMKAIGIPVVPGSDGSITDVNEALEVAEGIGYPVMVKAVAGGGGRGMRLVSTPKELENSYRMAQAETRAAFGDARLYIEKVMRPVRHIEFQVMGDHYGNIVHLGERECSIQRRYQKLVEESPSVAMTPSLRSQMGQAAVLGATSIGYRSAGTMEFLLDSEHRFYFMEMNTRIQVEHPVTEMIAGTDLVKEQIRTAAGEPLKIGSLDEGPKGHAIECRINAEDVDRGFIPCPGTIRSLNIPGGPGIRVDTHVYAGYTISPFYDSMVAKLLAYGDDREEALVRMERALEEFLVEGVMTTIPLHLRIIRNSLFRRGEIDTGFLEQTDMRNGIEVEVVHPSPSELA